MEFGDRLKKAIRRTNMRLMQSFLAFFYVLDQCYDKCREDDLGGLLGSISPDLWEDGKPIDQAVLNDWRDRNKIELLNNHNILRAIYDFLEYYQQKFGYNFSETKVLLEKTVNDEMITRALDKASEMYQRYDYSD